MRAPGSPPVARLVWTKLRSTTRPTRCLPLRIGTRLGEVVMSTKRFGLALCATRSGLSGCGLGYRVEAHAIARAEYLALSQWTKGGSGFRWLSHDAEVRPVPFRLQDRRLPLPGQILEAGGSRPAPRGTLDAGGRRFEPRTAHLRRIRSRSEATRRTCPSPHLPMAAGIAENPQRRRGSPRWRMIRTEQRLNE